MSTLWIYSICRFCRRHDTVALLHTVTALDMMMVNTQWGRTVWLKCCKAARKNGCWTLQSDPAGDSPVVQLAGCSMSAWAGDWHGLWHAEPPDPSTDCKGHVAPENQDIIYLKLLPFSKVTFSIFQIILSYPSYDKEVIMTTGLDIYGSIWEQPCDNLQIITWHQEYTFRKLITFTSVLVAAAAAAVCNWSSSEVRGSQLLESWCEIASLTSWRRECCDCSNECICQLGTNSCWRPPL